MTVNGNSAKSGETIFSGQQIQTPEGVGATVQLGGLGRVDIAPNTNLTLTFEEGKINVALVSGCVILTAGKGVVGTVQAGGAEQQTDRAKGGTIDVCTSQTPGAAPVIGQGAADRTYFSSSDGIQAICRLIEENEVGVVNERLRQSEPFIHSFRKFRNSYIAPLPEIKTLEPL